MTQGKDSLPLSAVQLEVILNALDHFEGFRDEEVFTCALELYAAELGMPLWRLFQLGDRYLGWTINWE